MALSDLVDDFLHEDRAKEAIKNEELTIDEVVEHFKKTLRTKLI